MKEAAPFLPFGPVSPADPEPLYGQLVRNVRREIAAGRLKADDALPSTRTLASGLRVSVITITRAYEELERDGIVYSRQGQGTFVSGAAAEKLRVEQDAPWKALLAAVAAARKAKISDDELVSLLKSALTRKTSK